MKQKIIIFLSLVFMLTINLLCGSQNGKLTYNGYIEENGVRVNGDRNLSFKLYDSILAGNLLWQSSEHTVSVTHGEYEYSLGENTTLTSDVLDRENIYIEVLKDSVVVGVRERIVKPPYATFATFASTASYASSVDWTDIENIPTDILDGDDINSLSDLGITVTPTKINYLSEVKSDIQAQLDNNITMQRFDSGWRDIEGGGGSKPGRTVTIDHKLGSIPSLIMAYMADENGNYVTPVNICIGYADFGIMVQDVTSETLKLVSYGNGPYAFWRLDTTTGQVLYRTVNAKVRVFCWK